VSAKAAQALLAPGTVLELAIEKAVYRGRGLGRLDGRVVFVPRAHPGDRVRARVRESHAGWAEAELLAVLEAAPARRAAPCAHAEGCGGCAYQQVDYAEQLRIKEAILRESLARAGVAWEGEIPVQGSPERGWRLRASLHFAVVDQALRLGFRPEGTRRLWPVEECQQLSGAMMRAALALRDGLGRREALARRLRGLDLLEAPEGGGLVATLDTSLAPEEASTLAALGRQAAGLTGFGVECDLGGLQWLHGSPYVHTSVLGLPLRAHARSFFQANRFLFEPLVSAAIGLVPREGGCVLDLYSGVGLFALPLAARDGGEVTAVEHAGSSTQDARWNAAQARLPVRVVESGVEAALAALPAPGDERILLDPPRSGAGPAVVDRIAARSPAVVVYVSCDPPTLARDLARFAVHGYRADAVRLFDLFPDTFHLETIVRLRKAAPL
jgi:23S rRNA (uracil1939-C5)-methyltransferase